MKNLLSVYSCVALFVRSRNRSDQGCSEMWSNSLLRLRKMYRVNKGLRDDLFFAGVICRDCRDFEFSKCSECQLRAETPKAISQSAPKQTLVYIAASGRLGSLLPFSASQHHRWSTCISATVTAQTGHSPTLDHAATRSVEPDFRCSAAIVAPANSQCAGGADLCNCSYR